MNTYSGRTALRNATIAEIVKRSEMPLGRTAVMKICYFLQVLKSFPLGYSFRIYTYGPYDGQVLEDLKMTEALDGVRSKAVSFGGGSGAAITAGPNIENLISPVQDFIDEHVDDFDSIMSQFGSRSASELEIQSTIVYVDQDILNHFTCNTQEIASRVHALKPHHKLGRIIEEVNKLKGQDVLTSVI